MRISFQTIICLAGVALVLSSCMRNVFAEKEPRLVVDTRELLVASDDTSGRNCLRDTVFVTSNRSWGTRLLSGGDWIEIENIGHLDLGRVSERFPIVLRFRDNETDSDRYGQLLVTSATGDNIVTIRQKAINYRTTYKLDEKLAVPVLACDADTACVYINSNTAWSIQVDPDSGIPFDFNKPSGKFSDSVKVFIPENFEFSGRSGKVLLTDRGGESKTIRFEQAPGLPYLRFIGATAADTTMVIEEGATAFKFSFRTNRTWKVEVAESSGYNEGDITFSQSTGDKSLRSVNMYLKPCVKFNINEAYIKVKFTIDGLEDEFVKECTQKPALRIKIYDPSKENTVSDAEWPFISPYKSEVSTTKNSPIHVGEETDLVHVTGNVFKIFSTKGIWRNSKAGLCFGEGVGDYIAFPVIEGCRPVRMKYVAGFTSSVRYLDLCEYDSGKKIYTAIPIMGPRGEQTDVVFDNPVLQPGKRYKLVNTAAANFNIRDLKLYYE